MIYSTPSFIFLFAITYALYWLFPVLKVRIGVLLASSFVFLAWAGLFDAFMFIGVAFVGWFALWLSERFKKRRESILIVGIAVVTLNLVFWKYAAWGVQQVQWMFPGFLWGAVPPSALPLGISFFTLQGISFLVDAMRRQQSYERPSIYFLYQGFFGQLIAGPIARGKELVPQLKHLASPKLSDAAHGLCLFSVGMAKKMLVADRFAVIVDPIFAEPGQYGRVALITAAVGFTVQIWADFSGYTDMGRGVARLLGIRLPENFRSPFLSQGPAEFWRRWHITLSEWIRDYLYSPLALRALRCSKYHFLGAVLFTMALCGLWHGASWTMVIFGLYHGVLLIGEQLIGKKRLSKVPSSFRVAVQFSLIAFGFIIFRVNDMGDFFKFVNGIFFQSTGAVDFHLSSAFWMVLMGCFLYQLCFYRNTEKEAFWIVRKLSFLQGFTARYRFPWGLGAGVCVGILCLLSLFFRVASQSQSFIYFQF